MERMTIEEMKDVVRKDPDILQHLPKFHKEILSMLINEEKGIEHGAFRYRNAP